MPDGENVTNGRIHKGEGKETVRPDYILYSILNDLITQLQSSCDGGGNNLSMCTLKILTVGQQSLLNHEMSTEEQLALADLISKFNQSIIACKGSLEQLQSSPHIAAFVALILGLCGCPSPQESDSEQVFSPDVFSLVASTLSLIVHECRVFFNATIMETVSVHFPGDILLGRFLQSSSQGTDPTVQQPVNETMSPMAEGIEPLDLYDEKNGQQVDDLGTTENTYEQQPHSTASEGIVKNDKSTCKTTSIKNPSVLWETPEDVISHVSPPGSPLHGFVPSCSSIHSHADLYPAILSSSTSSLDSSISNSSSLELLPIKVVTKPSTLVPTLEYSSTEESDEPNCKMRRISSISNDFCTDSVTSPTTILIKKRSKSAVRNRHQRKLAEKRVLTYRLATSESDYSSHERVHSRLKQSRSSNYHNKDSMYSSIDSIEVENQSSSVSSDSEPCQQTDLSCASSIASVCPSDCVSRCCCLDILWCSGTSHRNLPYSGVVALPTPSARFSRPKFKNQIKQIGVKTMLAEDVQIAVKPVFDGLLELLVQHLPPYFPTYSCLSLHDARTLKVSFTQVQDTRFKTIMQTKSPTSDESDDDITSIAEKVPSELLGQFNDKSDTREQQQTQVLLSPVIPVTSLIVTVKSPVTSIHMEEEVYAEQVDNPVTQVYMKEEVEVKHLDVPLTQVNMKDDSIIDCTSSPVQMKEDIPDECMDVLTEQVHMENAYIEPVIAAQHRDVSVTPVHMKEDAPVKYLAIPVSGKGKEDVEHALRVEVKTSHCDKVKTSLVIKHRQWIVCGQDTEDITSCSSGNTNTNRVCKSVREYKTNTIHENNETRDSYNLSLFSFDHCPIMKLVTQQDISLVRATASSLYMQVITEVMIACSLRHNLYDSHTLVLSWPTLLSPVLSNTIQDFLKSYGFIAFKASVPTSLHYMFGMYRPVIPYTRSYKGFESIFEMFGLIVNAVRCVKRCIPPDAIKNINFMVKLLNEINMHRRPSKYASLCDLIILRGGEINKRNKMKAKEEKGIPLQHALIDHQPSEDTTPAALTFTNTSYPLEVITSHFSKCCPRHDVQNVLTIVNTCPPSAAFGPKRRYCSINDLKDDTKHAPFNDSAGYSRSRNMKYLSYVSPHVMSDRAMVSAVTRDKRAEPVTESLPSSQQQLVMREPLAPLQPVIQTSGASGRHRRINEIPQQVPQSDMGIGTVTPEEAQRSAKLPRATSQVEKQGSEQGLDAGRLGDSHLYTDPDLENEATQREQLTQSRCIANQTSNDVRNASASIQHGMLSGRELEEFKETITSLDELLYAQDYGRIPPLSYDGQPPMYLPPEMRIPYIFITGLAYYKMSNHKKSVQYFQQCLRLAEECQRDGDVTICNIYIGDIDFAQRKYTDAAGRYQAALHYYSRDSVAKDFRMILPTKSAVWSKCGFAFKNASRVGDAVTAYEKAIEVASSKKDRLSAHTSLGNLFQGIGENERAVKEYEEAIDLATELGDDVSLGLNHGNLGNALLGLHLRDKALHHLFKALDMAVDYETTPQAIGRAYNNLGTAFQSLSEPVKAEECYDLALAQAIYGNDIPGQARVYGNIGNLQMLNKQYDRTVYHFTEVLRLSQDKATITRTHYNRSCAYHNWAEKNAATLRSSTNSSTRFKISLHGPEFDRCEDQYRPRRVPESVQKYYLQGTRDLEYVMKHHEENLHGIQGSPKGLSLSVSLFERNCPTYHRMQDCLINLKKSEDRQSRFEDALLVAEQSRARTFGELLLKKRGPQLQHQLKSPHTLDQLKFIVSRQSSPVVYLSYTGKRVLGWLFYPMSSNDCSLNMFEVPLSDNEFDGKSFDYHLRYSLNEQLVENSFEMYKPFDDNDKSKTEPVEKLYDLVAEPVMTMLSVLDKQQEIDDAKETSKDKVQIIVIIPDMYTNLLPFTCVLNRKTGKFWGDTHYFQVMPSLLMMGILDQLPAISVAIPVQHQQMLCVVGNPTIPPLKHNNHQWDLGKLPHATKEAEWVSHILKCKPILHEQATKDAVMMRIMNAKVIHLATHGSAVAGFLAFAGMSASSSEVVDAKEVLIYPEEIESLNISPALVVLSSCDSGRGVSKANCMTLPHAFILAGAQAVLTNLWRVPDESACIFMQFFYQYLVDGMKGTEALHKAILCLRCFSKYSQYIHWSGYQLTGREFQFDVNLSSARAELTTRLGQSSVFPQLDILKELETAFMNNPRPPTDVQVLHGPPGVKPSEPLIDFIHCHHLHFTGGIFWINCRTPQLIDASFSNIKEALGVKELTDIPDNETQPSLVVLDSLDQIPKDDRQLFTFLKRVSLHIVIISKSAVATDALQKAIDHELIRGTTIIDVQPLSTIHSTQRLVHSALKRHHLAPSRKEQEVFSKLAEFTTGSPPILDLTSSLVDLSLKQTDCSTEDALHAFAEQVQLTKLPQLKPPSVPRDSHYQPQEQFVCTATRHISREVYETIKTKDEDDVFMTSAEYDSWQVTTVLLRHCDLTPEEQLLLYCLSSFNCCPIPTSYVTELATIITKASHQPHLASSLHNKLSNNKILKVYPKPAVYHPNLTPSDDDSGHFVYVPRFISAAVWKDMMCDVDRVMALSTCFKAFSNAINQPPPPHEAAFYVGLGSLLVESYELHFRQLEKTLDREEDDNLSTKDKQPRLQCVLCSEVSLHVTRCLLKHCLRRSDGW